MSPNRRASSVKRSARRGSNTSTSGGGGGGGSRRGSADQQQKQQQQHLPSKSFVLDPKLITNNSQDNNDRLTTEKNVFYLFSLVRLSISSVADARVITIPVVPFTQRFLLLLLRSFRSVQSSSSSTTLGNNRRHKIASSQNPTFSFSRIDRC